jgi:hypothetical protein
MVILVFHAINSALCFYSRLQQSKLEFMSLTAIDLWIVYCLTTSTCGHDLQNHWILGDSPHVAAEFEKVFDKLRITMVV